MQPRRTYLIGAILSWTVKTNLISLELKSNKIPQYTADIWPDINVLLYLLKTLMPVDIALG